MEALQERAESLRPSQGSQETVCFTSELAFAGDSVPMAITTWISAWLVFVFELAVIAIAASAFLAVLFALFAAATKALRMHSAPSPTPPKGEFRNLPSVDPKKE